MNVLIVILHALVFGTKSKEHRRRRYGEYCLESGYVKKNPGEVLLGRMVLL